MANTPEERLAHAGGVQLGDTLRLDGALGGTFQVTGVATYDEPDPEDPGWRELTLQAPGRTLWLSCELDEDEGWVWATHDGFDEDDIAEIGALAGVVYKGGKPPKALSFMGRPFTVHADDHHYKVVVTERSTTEPEPDRYKARVTDYQDGAGSQLSLELWKGGRSLSLGRRYEGEVVRTGRASHE